MQVFDDFGTEGMADCPVAFEGATTSGLAFTVGTTFTRVLLAIATVGGAALAVLIVMTGLLFL